MTVTRMRPEARDDWAARLRSGAYPQGRRALAVLEEGTGAVVGYCCLGVLCEAALEAGVALEVGETAGNGGRLRTYDGESAVLPPAVIRWAGLRDANPAVVTMGRCPGTDGMRDGEWSLAGLNDDGRPFAEIAGLVEAQL